MRPSREAIEQARRAYVDAQANEREAPPEVIDVLVAASFPPDARTIDAIADRLSVSSHDVEQVVKALLGRS